MRLHRLRRIHVNGPNEPARLVGADGQTCEIDRTEPLPDVVEEWRGLDPVDPAPRSAGRGAGGEIVTGYRWQLPRDDRAALRRSTEATQLPLVLKPMS